MTLPQNVKDALALIETLANDEGDYAEPRAVETIRAHLMSQEAEIARLREENIKLHGWFNAEAQASGNMQYRLNKYESHLAAANALLQEAHGFIPVVYHSSGNPGLNYRIQTHLQGAGDE